MPIYMDIHNLPEGTTPEDVAKAHAKDMEVQEKYGVKYTNIGSTRGKKVFCLAHAPNAEAAEQVHREAHGMMPEKIIEVNPSRRGVFRWHRNESSRSGHFARGGVIPRSGIRTILFTDVVNSTPITQSLGDEAALAILGCTTDRARRVSCSWRS